ncbi:hypothetical protein [Paenibacillus sp. YYML68]|uniref:hypothetical protein n=1 Tax=Paenibacillus sp. YYML68 TaxID=2909250 RepID=UPI0024920A95|nr:hypothetical protein [Paenibacillus sp. YYML68]
MSTDANSKVRTKQSPRPIILERIHDELDEVPGGCLVGVHFERFMILDPRKKLHRIRIWLEEMYGDEYSRSAVIKKINNDLSYQGLKNIEECLKGSVRKGNISILAKAYGVPEAIITMETTDECGVKGLFIGKEEDEDEYFYRYFCQNGKKHILDDSDLSKYQWETDVKRLNEVDVEILIRVREPETGEFISKRNSFARFKLLSEDLPRLHDILQKDIEMISIKHKEYIEMREHIQELYQMLSAAERRIDQYEGIDPNERIMRELNQLLDN